MKDRPNKTYKPSAPFLLTTPAVGDQIGKFRLLEILGEGGMGTVFRAEDQRLRREVAVKVMKPEVARQENARMMFLREARSAAAVRSDRIVIIHEADEDGGVPYIAMELLVGVSLERYLEQTPVPTLAFTLAVAHQVAGGLHAAHTHPNCVIHRDVKPANVWLRAVVGRQGVDCLLLDFGLARAAGGDTLSAGNIKNQLGTPAYMAPEQWDGKGVDHQSDLFSLGVMLYQMATGVKPFAGDSARELLYQVCFSPKLPDRADVCNPQVPVAFASLIADLLAREKSERVKSAAEVMSRLGGIHAPDEPVLVARPGPMKPVPRPPQAMIPTPARSEEWTPNRTIAQIAPRRQPRYLPWVVTAGSVLFAVGVWAVILSGGLKPRKNTTGAGTQPLTAEPVTPPGVDEQPPPSTKPRVGPSTHAAVTKIRPKPLDCTVASGVAATTVGVRQREWADFLDLRDRYRVDLGGGIEMEFVLIPPGQFVMGTSEGERDALVKLFPDTDARNFFAREMPHRTVTLTRPVYMAATEVTRGQFARFVADTGYKTDGEKGDGGGGWDRVKRVLIERDKKYLWRETGWEADDTHPVVNVSWKDAKAFAEWVARRPLPAGISTARLPREAEWEYACRAGTRSRYPNGSDDPRALVRIANVADVSIQSIEKDHDAVEGDDRFVFTAPVRSFPANPFGLHDMIGNVWEACEDGYSETYSTTNLTDPVVPATGEERVVRGGSWNHRPRTARPASRDGPPSSSCDMDCGFRLVLILAAK